METIRTYLENMFAALPITPDIERLKNDLLITMEDKYNELKAQGKSENEAVGVVISEFGNIDELVAEVSPAEVRNHNASSDTIPPEDDRPLVTMAIAEKYLAMKKTHSLLIAIGTSLCILGVAGLTFFASDYFIGDVMAIYGIVFLLVFVAIAVGLFVYAGHMSSKYEYLEQPIIVPDPVKHYTQAQKDTFASHKIIMLIIGIILCILSPLSVIVPRYGVVTAEDTGVSVLLLIVAIGVFFIVMQGVRSEGFDKLLEEGDYTPDKKLGKKKSESIVGAIAAVWWPLTVCIYLLWSFTTGDWGFTWIIWPIAGVLFAAIAGLLTTMYGRRNR